MPKLRVGAEFSPNPEHQKRLNLVNQQTKQPITNVLLEPYDYNNTSVPSLS